MRTLARIIIAVGALAAAGCGGRGGHSQRLATDPDPESKIPAIEQAVRNKDRKVIPQLVTDLDDEDAAVRLYAIGALRRFTGEDHGYRCYDDAQARKRAVEEWKQWLAKQPK